MPRKPRRPTVLALTVVPGGRDAAPVPTPIPGPPSGLLVTYQEQWVAFWSSPLVQVVVPELDRDTIETLFKLRDERERALRAGRRQRLVLGSQGQPVLNPLLDYAIKLQKDIRALEDRLALNPKARSVLGVLIGDAHRSLNDLNAEIDAGDDLGDLLDDDDLADMDGSG